MKKVEGVSLLLLAADEDLNPVLVSEVNDDIETITIQIDIGNRNLRIINGYGPQEDDKIEDIMNFWQEIETEVINAKDNNCMVIIQLDANAKVGKKIIKSDPNNTSNNGKILIDFIKRQNLTLVNAMELCTGTITRQRIAGNNLEKSVLDYIIVCEEMSENVAEMSIDEDRIHTLTRYMKSKNKQKIIPSDHNVLHAIFNIAYRQQNRKIRKEIFQYKSYESRTKFFNETNNSNDLSTCFNNDENFVRNSKQFFKKLQGKIHKCFTKIRIKSGKSLTMGNKNIQEKLNQKTKLKSFIKVCKNTDTLKDAEDELMNLEKEIFNEHAKMNTEFVKEQIKTIELIDGKFSQQGFWKIKQKLCPRASDPPMAKRDIYGNIITAPQALKNLYLETYKKRLRQRSMKADYMDIFYLKSKLWQSRYQYLKHIKTPNWNMNNLDNVLKSLKNNKTQDPSGMINELFKQGCIGDDLKIALLGLFNGIKAHQLIPTFMSFSNITSIFKNKGSRLEMKNERGIFILNVLKKIIDKLIYVDNYEGIDSNMSDSNAGARRNRNIKDHLLVIHGVINSVVRGNMGCIDIQIYDLEQAFDSLWLEDCLNDVIDTIPEDKRDDKITLLHKANQNNYVAIKTAAGLTRRENITNIVQQGGTLFEHDRYHW